MISKIIAKLFSSFALIVFLLIAIGIPIYFIKFLEDTGNNIGYKIQEMLRQPKPQYINVHSSIYGTHRGQMNTTGLSIAFVKITESDAFQVLNNFNTHSTIQPYDKDKKLVIVTIIVENNSDLVNRIDNVMIPSVNDFKLVGNKEYSVDQHALQDLTVHGIIRRTPFTLKVSENERMLLPFDVDKSENIYNMKLIHGSKWDVTNAMIKLEMK